MIIGNHPLLEGPVSYEAGPFLCPFRFPAGDGGVEQARRWLDRDIEQAMNRRKAEIPPIPLIPPFPKYKKWIAESLGREKCQPPTTTHSLLFILFFGGIRGKRGNLRNSPS